MVRWMRWHCPPDTRFKPWRSEVEHITSRSRRIPTILNLYEWASLDKLHNHTGMAIVQLLLTTSERERNIYFPWNLNATAVDEPAISDFPSMQLLPLHPVDRPTPLSDWYNYLCQFLTNTIHWPTVVLMSQTVDLIRPAWQNVAFVG